MCVCVQVPRRPGNQIPLELELKVPVNHPGQCWDLNLGPLQEQEILLSVDLSL